MKFRFARGEYLLDIFLARLEHAVARMREGHQRRHGLPRLWVEPGDYVSQCVLATGLYEKYHCLSLARLLQKRERDVFLDVGANLGNHTTFFAPHFRRVLAFEPNALTRQALELNLAHNGLTNVEVLPYGLSDQAADLPFEARREGNLGGSQFTPGASGTARVEPGDAVLERLLTPTCRVSFLKVDVEGHEPEVLRGLAGTLARHRPVVAFEVGFGQGEEVMQLLRQAHPYQFFDLAPGHKPGGLPRLLWQGPSLELKPLERLENRYYPLVIALP